MNNNFKASNDDIDFSGIFVGQYPKEEEWYKELKNKLSKFIFKKPVNITSSVNDVMHPRDYNYIVNNFIALFNSRESPKMKLLRQGANSKKFLNKSIVDYHVNFFVSFPDRKSYYGYEIYVNCQRDVLIKEFKFETSIVDVQLKGSVGLSDIQYGVIDNITDEKNVRFYKDTNKYGEYHFMFKDDEIKSILNEKGKMVNSITETDKKNTDVKIPISIKRDIYQNRYQRGQPPNQPKYVSKFLYTNPSESKGKLQIGNSCIDLDKNNNAFPNNCYETKALLFSI